MAGLTVLYDACVLYPAPLRDLLMHLALTGLFHARWTDEIHEEWMRNLLENRPDLKRKQLERTRELMDSHAPDCLVRDYQGLIEGLQLPDPGDRHVLAAAIRSGSAVIVTYNLDDFPSQYLAQFGIEAQHPDQFITRLIDYAPGKVCLAAKRQRANLRNPPKTVEQFFDALERQQLPETVARLRTYEELI